MQVIYWGKEKTNAIHEQFNKNSIKKILLVTGKNSYNNSTASNFINELFKDYDYIRFYDFDKNPKEDDLLKGIDFYNSNNCDAIVAIGGGSVIDMAKLIKAFCCSEENTHDLILNNAVTPNNIPLCAIPTTSGSGSESTHFAVAYVDNKKFSVSNNSLLPDIVFLVPELTYSMSSYLTAITGLDAFSQAIESWWSINSTKESIKYSKQAVKKIWDNLENAVHFEDHNASSEMLHAANIAGKAINIAKTTAPHALSYGFTVHCNLPHGNAVSLFLPYFIHLHMNVNESNSNDKRGVDWIKNTISEISATLEIKKEELAQKIAVFINKCNVSINFKELGISKSLFNKAIADINLERLNNNPVKIDLNALDEIYNSNLNKKRYR